MHKHRHKEWLVLYCNFDTNIKTEFDFYKNHKPARFFHKKRKMLKFLKTLPDDSICEVVYSLGTLKKTFFGRTLLKFKPLKRLISRNFPED